jgi:hypothetical protein
MAAMVVQLGLATMPLGIIGQGVRIDLGHHQRHVGVERQAEELSITIAPGRGDLGRQRARGVAAGREEHDVQAGDSRRSRRPRPRSPGRRTRAWSRPSGPRRTGAGTASGKSRSASRARIISPTRPVAPTTPTRGGLARENLKLTGLRLLKVRRRGACRSRERPAPRIGGAGWGCLASPRTHPTRPAERVVFGVIIGVTRICIGGVDSGEAGRRKVSSLSPCGRGWPPKAVG